MGYGGGKGGGVEPDEILSTIDALPALRELLCGLLEHSVEATLEASDEHPLARALAADKPPAPAPATAKGRASPPASTPAKARSWGPAAAVAAAAAPRASRAAFGAATAAAADAEGDANADMSGAELLLENWFSQELGRNLVTRTSDYAELVPALDSLLVGGARRNRRTQAQQQVQQQVQQQPAQQARVLDAGTCCRFRIFLAGELRARMRVRLPALRAQGVDLGVHPRFRSVEGVRARGAGYTRRQNSRWRRGKVRGGACQSSARVGKLVRGLWDSQRAPSPVRTGEAPALTRARDAQNPGFRIRQEAIGHERERSCELAAACRDAAARAGNDRRGVRRVIRGPRRGRCRGGGAGDRTCVRAGEEGRADQTCGSEALIRVARARARARAGNSRDAWHHTHSTAQHLTALHSYTCAQAMYSISHYWRSRQCVNHQQLHS